MLTTDHGIEGGGAERRRVDSNAPPFSSTPPAFLPARWALPAWVRLRGVRVALVAAACVVVCLGFWPVYLGVRGGAFAMVLLPVVLGGLLLGMRGGVATAGAMAGLLYWLSHCLGYSPGQAAAATAISVVPIMILGLGVGRLRDLTVEVRESNEALRREMAERRRLEEERRRIDAAIQEAQKLEALGQLAGGVAHDFNNLLTGVLGNASLALSSLEHGAPARVAVEEIEIAARRAAALARQMLAYSGRGRFEVAAVDLSALVEDAIRLARATVSKRTTIACRLGEGLPPVEVDTTELHQVLLNLVVNASEAMPDGDGTVMISTGVCDCTEADLVPFTQAEGLRPGTYVRLVVEDTGCGMDAPTRTRIFEPFYSTKFAGRGLGLAAVLGIVRGHKGAIAVESEPNQGSKFTVLLPATSAAPRPAPAAASSVVEGSQLPSGAVLVVDDEPMIRRLAGRALRSAGYEVLLAEDGHAAIDVFRDCLDDIALVVLDLTMPTISGVETLDLLRALSPSVHVLFTSGYTEEEVTAMLADRRVDGFLQKPFEHDVLLAKVRSVFDQPSRSPATPLSAL